jgi:hypothetical protein
LNDSGSSSTFAVAVAEDVGRVPAVDAEQPRLEARRDDRLDQRLPGLEILAGQRRAGPGREIDQRRDVSGQVWRRVGVGDAFANRRVGVDHARRDGGVVLLEGALEALDCLVRGRLGREDLGAAAPYHHQPIELVIALELADVGDHLLGEILLVLALLDVRAVESLDVALIEDGRPRPDFLELGTHPIEQRRLDDASGPRRGVAVLFEDVPAAEHQIVQRGERHDIADSRRAILGSLPEADGAHLGERADWFGKAVADGEDAGDCRGADRAETNQQDTEFAPRRSDVDGSRHEPQIISLSAIGCQLSAAVS